MNEDILIQGRFKDLGGFQVCRTLPHPKKRSVGPFVFVDHMGPMQVDETHRLNVRPHPHIGLATVTYLFDGQGYHRDSLGSKQAINPGDLNWMTAGKGIVHSERTPTDNQYNSIHGVQIWVALPIELEECEPSFIHWPKQSFTNFEFAKGMNAKLLLGKYQKFKSPVATFWKTLFIDCESASDSVCKLSFQEQEIAFAVISGQCEINRQKIQENDMLVVADPKSIDLQVSNGTRFIILGGDPFPEPRYMWWNFVSSRKERIHQAADDWENQRFGKVESEIDFIPLPNDPLP